MDPITATSALTSSNLASELTGAASGGSGGMLVQQTATGGSFAFHLPQPIEMTTPTTGVDSTAQIFSTNNEPTTFGHLAQQMVRQVNDIQSTAGEKVRDVLMGGKTSINDAMVSVQESSVAFNLLVQVRNKVVDSYQQIMSMQV